MPEPASAQDPESLSLLLEEHRRTFQACYGPEGSPRTFFSPGRVNLFGGHLDYSGGPVMPTAIDRGTFIAARKRSDRRIRIASTIDPRGLEIDLDRLPDTRVGRWVDYPLGVVIDVVVRARGLGRAGTLFGLDILFGGNLPIGAGLSSSASICVGTAFTLDRIWELGLGAEERVRSALRAERGFVGVQCGIMDPFAVGYARPGHLLWLQCRDETFEHLPLDFSRVSILIADSGVQRELAKGAFNERVDQCRRAFEILSPHAPQASVLADVPSEVVEAHVAELPGPIALRARHVASEVARTFEAREALLAGDLSRMGACMYATHESLRDLYECSCEELDLLVEAASESEGALGSRLTGAGFGGCTVILTARGREQEVANHVVERFEQRYGRRIAVEAFGGDDGPRELTLS